MTVIDAHTHVWGFNTDEYPWQAEILPPGWDGAYTTPELLADMDTAGVDEAVIVTTPLYGRGRAANAYTEAAIEAHPDRFYGVGLMEFFPDDPADAAASLRRVVSSDRILGVRIHAALEYERSPTTLDRHGDWFLDDRLQPIFEAAGEVGAAVFVFPKAQQLTDIAKVIDDNPSVQFVVDHMAWPDKTTDSDEKPWTSLETIAEYDNVAVKVSSLPRSSAEDWPYRDLWGYVRNLLDWYGVDRLMLGSDYPWMSSWATYDECLSWVDEATFLSDRDRRYLRGASFHSIHG